MRALIPDTYNGLANGLRNLFYFLNAHHALYLVRHLMVINF